MFHTEILIKGELNSNWSGWFDGLEIHPDGSGDTLLTGILPDQSAVYGMFSRLSSLKITLVSVSCREENDTGPPLHSIETLLGC